ncbi:MAG: hypothetical protein KJ666_05855 [Bacteroidetes bacterium]|nr:hypothetical protein [Bacteroidota bacterium]
MELINGKYVIDEHNQKVAIQIDIETFQKIEEILENFALVQLMKENENDKKLNLDEAKKYYQALEKAN